MGDREVDSSTSAHVTGGGGTASVRPIPALRCFSSTVKCICYRMLHLHTDLRLGPTISPLRLPLAQSSAN